MTQIQVNKGSRHQQNTVQELAQESEAFCAGLLDGHAISKDVNLHTGNALDDAACDTEDGRPQHMFIIWS